MTAVKFLVLLTEVTAMRLAAAVLVVTAAVVSKFLALLTQVTAMRLAAVVGTTIIRVWTVEHGDNYPRIIYIADFQQTLLLTGVGASGCWGRP